MKLNHIELENFKCFSKISLELDPHLNLFVGINGTGKSSILEALRIITGSIFLSVDKYKKKIYSPSISVDDVQLKNLEPQYPVILSATGFISNFKEDRQDKIISWERSLETHGGLTRNANAREMKDASNAMQLAIRNGKKVTIPLIAYYSTDRYKKERNDYGTIPEGSRLNGFFNSLDSTTNIKFFLDLYYTETLSAIQQGRNSVELKVINDAVKTCLNCENLYYDIKKQELIYKDKSSHELMPFHLLSDGVRSMLAMVMEIAFRCYLLNPHLKGNAAKETDGIVLIDEIDLHLHPSWQMHVLNDLRNAFPKIQFIVTTHAPIVIGSIKEGRIFCIINHEVSDFGLQIGRDANYILREMGAQEMDQNIKKEVDNYYIMIENGKGNSTEARHVRTKLENLIGKDNTLLQRADVMLSFFK